MEQVGNAYCINNMRHVNAMCDLTCIVGCEPWLGYCELLVHGTLYMTVHMANRSCNGSKVIQWWLEVVSMMVCDKLSSTLSY